MQRRVTVYVEGRWPAPVGAEVVSPWGHIRVGGHVMRVVVPNDATANSGAGGRLMCVRPAEIPALVSTVTEM